MSPELLNEIIEICRRRVAQGAESIEPPLSVETLEQAVTQLAQERDAQEAA